MSASASRSASSMIIALLGCGSTPPPSPLAHRTEPAAAAPIVDPGCAGPLSPHRETLLRGVETEVAAFGKRARYLGQSHDPFDDGTTAVVLSIEVFGEPWLPDARDRAFHAFGDHCVRVVSSTADELELEVALQPAHQYDQGRCHLGCCEPSAQQQLAPDGSIECCFCSDDPTP